MSDRDREQLNTYDIIMITIMMFMIFIQLDYAVFPLDFFFLMVFKGGSIESYFEALFK